MTNSCNREYFSLRVVYLLDFLFSRSVTLLSPNNETFSYLPLMFLSDYINIQEKEREREIGIIDVPRHLSLNSLRFFLFLFSSFSLSLSLVIYSISISLFIRCVQIKETEIAKKHRKTDTSSPDK